MLPVIAVSLQAPSACPQPGLLLSSYKEEVGPGQYIKSVTKELIYFSHATASF